MTIERINRCQFCGKKFSRESWFLRHMCAKKRKFEETNDVVCQHAFRVYTYWMQGQNLIRRGKQPDFNKFGKSPFKKTFIELVLFCREFAVHSIYDYVDWLIKSRVSEAGWKSDKTLERYMAHMIEYEDPEEQAIWTANQIDRWVLENPEKRSVPKFFDALTPSVILRMTKLRILKPWVLFGYEPIASKWLDDPSYNAEVFYQIDEIVNSVYWSDKISQNPDGITVVTQIMDELWEPYQT